MIHITTTHTITCDNAPVKEVYRELDEKFPQLNPIIEQKLKLREERDDARKSNQNLLTLNDALKLKVVELTRERDELKRKLEESLAVKEKLMAENANLEAANDAILAGGSRPALPEGMRIAEHPEYGRVVVSPGTDGNGHYKVFALDDRTASKVGYGYAKPSNLTFLDEEPAPAPLPKPEDCKAGERWLVRVNGGEHMAERIGFSSSNPKWPWQVTTVGHYPDSYITLLARLLPDRKTGDELV